jgi:aminoglycoside phosphotransferase (APT) family kinase protein
VPTTQLHAAAPIGSAPDGDADVVPGLIRKQFPQWADLAIQPVELDGWDNRMFRLGDEMSVRLPSLESYVSQIDKEHRWHPVLARHLPLPIPTPIAKGTPGSGLAMPWSFYRWLDGEPAALAGVRDLEQLARGRVELPCARRPALRRD